MSSIISDQYIRIEPRPATIGPRLLAATIDMLVVMAYVFLFAMFGSNVQLEDCLSPGLIVAMLMLPPLLYQPLFESFMGGRTLGKLAMGLRVVRLDGGPPAVSAFFIRWLLLSVDVGTGLTCGVLCIVFSRNAQRLGDMAAGTMVINERSLSAANLRQQLGVLTTSAPYYVPHFPQAMPLSSRQADVIGSALSRYDDRRVEVLYTLCPKVEAATGVPRGALDAEAYLVMMLQDYWHKE